MFSLLRPCLQDVQDSHEEAAKVAPQALKLCKMVQPPLILLQVVWFKVQRETRKTGLRCCVMK